MDIVTPQVRSRMMSGIGGKNTKPELILRSALHRTGFRFRLHRRDLPGRPDLFFPKHRAALFIHGCFWHWHDCHLFKWPSSREEFWREKINGNAERDRRQVALLKDTGIRVGVVWECALKGRTRLQLDDVIAACSQWLASEEPRFNLHGHQARTPVGLL